MTTHPERIATEDLRHRLSSRLGFYRRRTKDLIDPLDDDDLVDYLVSRAGVSTGSRSWR